MCVCVWMGGGGLENGPPRRAISIPTRREATIIADPPRGVKGVCVDKYGWEVHAAPLTSKLTDRF